MNDNNKKKFGMLKYIIVFLVPVICITIYMYMHGCYPFGKNTILIGDGPAQYYPFLKSLLEKMKNGESLLWDWHSGMGYDYYSTFFYYMASPFNVIALLIGLFNLELGVEITVIIQWSLCGVTMLYYLIHTKNVRGDEIPHGNLVRIVLALSYSMSNYILTYQHNFIWFISLIMAPLVMLGVEKLVNENKKKLYYISMVIVFITNFYFAWFICILAVIWFFVQKKSGVRDFIKKGFRFLGISVLAAVSCGAVLIPCYYTVLFCNRRDRFTVINVELFDNIANFFQGFFWSHNIDTSPRIDATYANIGYCGVYVLILCCMYLFNKNIPRKERLKKVLIIIISVFSLLFYYANFVLQGFTRTTGSPSRFAFIFVLILIVMAYESIANMSQIQIRWLCIIAVGFACVFAVVFIFNTDVQNLFCYLGTILLVAYCLICAFFYAKGEIRKKSFIMNIIVVAFIELVFNFFIGVGLTYYSASREIMLEADQWDSIYDNLNTDDGERKTAYISNQIYSAYSETDMFSSTINGGMVDVFSDLGMGYIANGRVYSYKYTTPLTAALFNVKYVLSDNEIYYGGYNKISSKKIYNNFKQREYDIGVYENEYQTGLGYVVDDSVLKWKLDDLDPITFQNNFSTDVLKENAIFEKVNLGNIDVAFDNTEIYDITGMECVHKSTSTNDIQLQYSFSIPEDMDMYVWLADNVSMQVDIYVDGNALMNELTVSQLQHLLHVGKVLKGQEVIVDMYISGPADTFHKTYFSAYAYNEQAMQSCVAAMKQQLYQVEKVTNRGVQGYVQATKPGILMTSVPYYKGMNVYVDGKRAKIEQIDGGLAGVRVDEGKHEIVFEYFPYGLKLGILISCLGIAISLAYWINSRKKAARYKI